MTIAIIAGILAVLLEAVALGCLARLLVPSAAARRSRFGTFSMTFLLVGLADAVWFPVVSGLDLRITTGNPALADLLGTRDLGALLSLSPWDPLFWLILAVLGTVSASWLARRAAVAPDAPSC